MKIPYAQNLSNLIRLAVLYKYGGFYLDTDFIILKDFSGLRNSIGAQSVDSNGNWTRLNNDVLIFDKNHPLVYEFLEEFASTFDGNKWGHNGPYLVSRMVAKNTRSVFYGFAPGGFLPRVLGEGGRVLRPTQPHEACEMGRGEDPAAKWVELRVHLWNRQSRGLDTEEGRIIKRLISNHCVTCNY